MRIFETSRRHPGPGRADRRHRAARARARRRRDARPRGDRLRCSRSAATTSAPTSGSSRRSSSARSSSASSSSRGGRGRRSRGSCPLAAAAPARAARCARSTRAIHAYREHAAAAGRRLRADAGDPGGARARDLARRRRRSGSICRRAPYYVMGPLLFLVMLVPFTINGLAVREAFFVSFLGGLGVDADAAFATGFLFFVVTIALSLPGRGDPRLGGPARRGARLGRGPRPHGVASRRSSSPTTRCRGSSGASRASQGYETIVVDNGSSDGTRRPRPRAVSRRARRRAGEPRPRRRAERGHPRDDGRVRSSSSTPTRGRVDDAVERLVAFADEHPRRGGRRAAARATRTGRCSAPCAASRRRGGSRPSTSSCASSRRVRAR